MTKEVTIPNWTVFGAAVAGLSILTADLVDPDGENVDGYQAAFDIFLDDGTVDPDTVANDKNAKHITICTDIVGPDINDVIRDGAAAIVELFENVQSTILVLDDAGDVVDSFEMDDFIEDVVIAETLADMENPSGVLH